jgi:beta-galactosidase
MSTGYESGGYGLIQLDGTITPRSRVAGDIARAVDRNQRLFLDARPAPAEVAIVYNPMAYMVGGRQRAATTTGPQSEVGSIERDSWLGAYRALYPSNVPVEYVHINELGDLGRYKLVIFPYPLMMPEKAAAVLREYVRNGGNLVSEARLGWNNERGRASETIPGLGLFEVTGCRETAVQSVAGLRTELRWESDDIPGLKTGDRLAGRLYEETLEPSGPGARVAARFANGAPAAVIARYGKGRALTLGSYVAVTYELQRDAAVQRFFTGLLEWAGVARPVEVSGGEAEVRFTESGTSRIMFVFNHGEKEIAPTIALRLQPKTAVDMVSGRAVPVEAGKVQRKLAPGGVWVVKLER